MARPNDLQPDALAGYASMIRAMATSAWQIPPFNVHAATETGGIAAECARHRGLHLFEDLHIPEIVDDHYQPDPAGQPGDRLLVTVLSSRTLPLIRYEMTDRVTLATGPCPDGLPFRLLASIEGRTDDILTLPATAGGTIRVHPVVFRHVLGLLDAGGWQVRQGERDITVLIAAPAGASTLWCGSRCSPPPPCSRSCS